MDLNQKAIEVVRTFFQELLERLGERAQVDVSYEAEGLYVNLTGTLKRIPENEPQLRSDLARIARLHVQARLKKSVPLVLDMNGRWAAHRQALVELAKRLAERAVTERKKVRLDPMPPEDRRIVHLALSDYPGVRTYSVGKGAGRRVVIEPVG
jgi:spoIIIJ-associated protein